MSPKENHTPLRSIRVQGELWDAAQRVAAEHGETLSEVMRRALQDYVKTGGRPKKGKEKA